MRLFTIALASGLALAAATPRSVEADCAVSCPAGNVCAFEDCTPCNSGSFCVICQCHPVPNKVTCNVQTGNCAGSCAWCKSVAAGQTCWTYVGCGGQGCSSNHCDATVAAPLRQLTTKLAAESCPDCTTAALETSSGIPTEVSTPSGFPVEYQAFEAVGMATGGQYKVVNHSSAGLVTLITSVTVTDDKDQQFSFVLVADSWEQDAPFAKPTAAAVLPATVRANAKPGVSLRRISIRPLYAEFEDGQRIGADADGVHGCLAADREILLEKHRRALAAYSSGGAAAFDVFIQENELAWLSLEKANRGVLGAVAALKLGHHLVP